MSAIAIVGIGCRFAGAPDLQSYWRLTRDGANSFGPVPADRWDISLFETDNRRAADKTYAHAGAFIENIKSFPALALGIPPRRVDVMDPQQRLSLEVSLQAIQDAGHRPEDLPRRTAVFVGVTAVEYRELLASRPLAHMMAHGAFGQAPADPSIIAAAIEKVLPPRPYSAPGVLANMCAATVSQELDLHGPSYTVDAACASSLMAVADAVYQLRAGAIDAALASGVYLNIMPDHYVAFSRIGAMSGSGVCRPFDDRADGFVQGEGAGAVLLKRLEDATRDGDRIYAVIRGISANSDGHGDGPMAPLASGQAEVIRHAWDNSGLDPATLGYVETHGTGTRVGDPTELSGLMQAIGDQAKDVVLGASKANIGHTMSAAGVAGLIRATLALHHKTLPPLANYEQEREDLGLGETPFRIIQSAQPWQDDERVAGVSSFGFGGTNAHVVLSSAPTTPPAPKLQPELVLMSAPDLSTLKDLARQTAASLSTAPHATVAGVARAWAKRPPQHARLGLVASSVPELVSKLEAVGAGDYPAHTHYNVVEDSDNRPRVAFLYPGQGSQRPGMLAEIRERFPVVRETLQELEDALSDELPLPLTHLLYPELRQSAVDHDTANAELTHTPHCQPVLLACATALTRLLAQVGVQPTVIAGHSLGEFSGAVTAGVLSAADAARFVARRGLAMENLSGDRGAMIALRSDAASAEGLLVDGAIIANYNHPKQVVVSGLSDAVNTVATRAKTAGIDVVSLEVSHGFHSPALSGLAVDELVDELAIHPPSIPLASGISDTPYGDVADARETFKAHALSPVRFTNATAQCEEAGVDIYLQVGAGGPLAAFTRGNVPGKPALTLASRDDSEGVVSVLETLARLWSMGVAIDVEAITAKTPVTSVPPVILPRQDYWIVKDTGRFQPDMGEARAPQAAPEQHTLEVAAPKEAKPETSNEDELKDTVIKVVAKVSAYPLQAIRPTMTLADDLGFDSLMVADLVTGLTESFSGLDGIPQEMLINNPTVQELQDYVRIALEGGDSNALGGGPLRSYQPTWRATKAPEGEAIRNIEGARLLVVSEDTSVDMPALRDFLSHSGATVEVCTAQDAPKAGPADLILYRMDRREAATTPQGETTRLIALLDAQARHEHQPDLIAMCADEDALADGVRAIVRSVAQEWPDSVAKTLTLQRTVTERDRAELALREWQSPERSVDIRYNGAGRQILSFEAQPEQPVRFEPGPGESVLVTGGTRGIGATVVARLAASGARVIAVGRSAPSESLKALIARDDLHVSYARADVTDSAALLDAVIPHRPITAVVHAAGLLADGALGTVDPELGARAQSVKSAGWLNALEAAGPELKVMCGLGSWAGRFGNRHQAHYAAANALMAGLTKLAPEGVRAVVSEFGPWNSSAMAATIPDAVKAAMRADGVDFVDDEEGLSALLDSLASGEGVLVHARRAPSIRRVEARTRLSLETHPYLRDHAISERAILPLAGAADLLVSAAVPSGPFELNDLRLFKGIVVDDPVALTLTTNRGKAELRLDEGKTLAYRARVRHLTVDECLEVTAPPRPEGGQAPTLSLREFYDEVTFHGPMLQGIVSIDSVGADFVLGRVRGTEPSAWIPESPREAWRVDPLALDSAMQLAAYVAWTRFQRQGTPVSIGRLVQVQALPRDQHLQAEVHFDGDDADRFSATIALRDEDGALLLLAEQVVAELKEVVAPDAAESTDFVPKAEWTDPSLWPGYKDIELRLKMAAAAGISNPYFHVHDGTARDVTSIEGRELINFSSYNYLGLSGDERVLNDVTEALHTYGTSVSASRVASGERPFHGALERELAAAQGVDDALVFTAGHAANVSTIGHLMGPEDLVLHDELIHDSALGGIKLSGAARRGFKHEDPADLEAQLKELRPHYQKVMIIVEGVYSMDGDICDLPAYIAIKKRYGCLLMVDEAHSFGVVGASGCGLREHFDIDGSEVDVWMGTLSKSLASCGGWIAGSSALIKYLRYTVGGFVYSAGLTPANGQAALSCLRLMLAERWRVEKLQTNARVFHAALAERGLDTGTARGESAVVPCVTGNSIHAMTLSQRLIKDGINVQPIVYPAVPDDAARLRYFLSAAHSEEQLRHTANRTADLLEEIVDEERRTKERRKARFNNS